MATQYEAEQSVIGGLMLLGDMNGEAASKVLSMTREQSFSNRVHGLIFKAIKQLAASGQAIDPIIVDSQLIKNGDSESTGGYAYIIDITKNTPSAANILSYADILRQSAIERVATSKLNNALAMIQDPTSGSIYEKLGRLESEIQAIMGRANSGRSNGLVHVSDIASKWQEDLENRFENPTASAGYSTGIESLDKKLAPKLLRKGSLVAIGARPKMGKTALMAMLIKHFSLEHKKAVATFSLEMPSDQIFERMICERSRVDSKIFYEGADDDTDFAKVSVALGEYVNSNLYIDDTPGITIGHVQAEARKLASKQPLGMIAIDYLTLMKAEKADRNDLAYGEITKALKNLAKELDCVVVLLTQLNRGLESRTNKRPMPSDSKDTGQIEQDCDLWIGLYREAVYDDTIPPEQKGLTELIVRLNRHGECGTVMLNLKGGYFEEAGPMDFIVKDGNRNQDNDDY